MTVKKWKWELRVHALLKLIKAQKRKGKRFLTKRTPVEILFLHELVYGLVCTFKYDWSFHFTRTWAGTVCVACFQNYVCRNEMTLRFLESVEEEAFESLLCLKEKHIHTFRMQCSRSIENFSKLNVWLNTTCAAEASRDGCWEMHTLHEQFSGKLQRAKRCNRFTKRILHEPQKILSLHTSLFALWNWRCNIVGSEPSSEGSVVIEFFLKLNAS